jgi:hypothetical protein
LRSSSFLVLTLHAKRAIILLRRLDTDVQLAPNLHDGFHAHVYVYDMIRMVASIHKHGDKATRRQAPHRMGCATLQGSGAPLCRKCRNAFIACSCSPLPFSP